MLLIVFWQISAEMGFSWVFTKPIVCSIVVLCYFCKIDRSVEGSAAVADAFCWNSCVNDGINIEVSVTGITCLQRFMRT